MAEIKIGDVSVGDDHSVFFVAEIGINHNGNVDIAKKLIDAAKSAGCQAVKFQKRTVPAVYTAEELAKPREVPRDIVALAMARGVLSEESVKRLKESKLKSTTNGDLKWALELTLDDYREIDVCCKEKGILWFASPWDEASVDFLEQFQPPAYKMASAALTDDDLLHRVRSKKRPVILSTGMSTLDQMDYAVDILGKENLAILHCVSTYPSEVYDLNLRVIPMLKSRYGVPVGYSGHERGIEPSVYAVAYGACIIERHITLDRGMWGSDQSASIEPPEFFKLVKSVQELKQVGGDGQKRLLDAEIPIMKKLRKK